MNIPGSANASAPSIALQRSTLRARKVLAVGSASFKDLEAIPPHFSGYAENLSPSLYWSACCEAKSYMLLVEDPDAKAATSRPMLHWIAWNIPVDVTSLAEALDPAPAGMVQGRNGHGDTGYMGMRPPMGDPPHHYHFQVFALDRMLKLRAGSDRDAVLAAASGHVFAAGETIGTFQHETPQD